MIRVGCCGWPVSQSRYYDAFDLIEVQESFYRLPRVATVEKWRAAAPSNFEFVLKAPQLITHEPSSPTYRRLRTPLSGQRARQYGAFRPTAEILQVWDETLTLARTLRSAIVLFQCPGSFALTAEHVGNLKTFFRRVDRGGLAFAWEPRGAWSDGEVKALCKRLELIHCVDPFQRRSVWGEPAYFRLHGRGGYHYRYSEAELRELLRLLKPYRHAYVLFNNSAMFDDARSLSKLLG
ncbi:MAG: DUF72 domain-containing protein [Candidatus Methylomirabilia bacterium]